MKFVALLLFAAILVLPVSASSPEITTWYNDKTYDSNLDIIMNISESINFNITSNQTIDTWNWSIDNVDVPNNNFDNFTASWGMAGVRNVSVNATNNTNGTSSTITWKITVKEFSPEISSWYNNKTNDDIRDITINTSEIIKFNVTANQSIDSWNWTINNVNVPNNNFDNYTIFWATAGIRNVSVNAINSNGTSSTVTWKITVKKPVTITSPDITSWYNNKTNNAALNILIKTNETIKFNLTANQGIDTWKWSIDNVDQHNNYDNFSISWTTAGIRNVSVNATNSNGSDTITWKVTVKTVTEKGIILSWEPEQIVDYIYVNDTITETIEYSITTSEPMDEPTWTVDGIPVTGTVSGNTYSYTLTWDNKSIGAPHKIIFTGDNDGSPVIFKWYVNVYEIGDYSGGRDIFDIIDDALRNHATDVKIRMEKRKMHKMGDQGNEYLAQKVNRLHDEIDKRQSTRSALREDFKSGIISSEDYVAALQQAQIDAKYNKKLAQGYAKIAKDEMKNEKLSLELLNILQTEEDLIESKDKGKHKGREK
ncbi:MAG: hypothetical protein P1P80_06910 [ANME-2 cluster archaeon]|nr:hypothetical protein [ANME-2 cluster archaeon]